VGNYADPLDFSQVHDDEFGRLHGNFMSSLRHGRLQACTVDGIFPFNDKWFRMVPKAANQTAG
jgi:hypothetical protein